MELTRSVVLTEAEEYRAEEPLYTVENEQLETLPGAFENGTFGRRDAEWVVRWYYRRFLGAFPESERQAGEERFERNDTQRIVETVESAATAPDAATGLDRLLGLEGVDVRVASAFLMFAAPEEYIVVGEREWTVLRDAGELRESYPDPPSTEEYGSYLETCRSVADRLDCDLWTLYRALWRLWKERHA